MLATKSGQIWMISAKNLSQRPQSHPCKVLLSKCTITSLVSSLRIDSQRGKHSYFQLFDDFRSLRCFWTFLQEATNIVSKQSAQGRVPGGWFRRAVLLLSQDAFSWCPPTFTCTFWVSVTLLCQQNRFAIYPSGHQKNKEKDCKTVELNTVITQSDVDCLKPLFQVPYTQQVKLHATRHTHTQHPPFHTRY